MGIELHWWDILNRHNLRTDEAADRLASREHNKAFMRVLIAGALAAALGIPVGIVSGLAAGGLIAAGAFIAAWVIYNKIEKSIDGRVNELANLHKERNKGRA
ncbi:MAG: hypothetical protein AAB573_02475 [Patescibacteria group bacterium]